MEVFAVLIMIVLIVVGYHRGGRGVAGETADRIKEARRRLERIELGRVWKLKIA